MPTRQSEPMESRLPSRRERGISAVQQVYEEIRGMIVDLSLKPGTILSKAELAERFRVSQTPVREALLRLEDEGLVEIFPQSRTLVSYIDVQSAREAHFLRLGVEVEIARRLGRAINETEAAELRDLVERQARAQRAQDYSTFTQLDNRLHQRIYEMAGVGGLWDLIDSRRAHLDRLRRLHLPTRGKATAILREHRAIIDAFEANDPEAAEAAVREHLRGTVSATEEIRSHFPEYFR